jgi:hypothetical protein
MQQQAVSENTTAPEFIGSQNKVTFEVWFVLVYAQSDEGASA